MSDIGHGDYCPYDLPKDEDTGMCWRCAEDQEREAAYFYALYKAEPRRPTADEIRDCYELGDPKRARSLREIGEVE